jgi:hypothetical protein
MTDEMVVALIAKACVTNNHRRAFKFSLTFWFFCVKTKEHQKKRCNKKACPDAEHGEKAQLPFFFFCCYQKKMIGILNFYVIFNEGKIALACAKKTLFESAQGGRVCFRGFSRSRK